MSTSASSVGSSTSGTSVFSPVTLNGVSQYSSDLQSVLTRAVAIAQIPITALQNSDSTVLQKESLLGQMQSTVQGLATSLSSLGTTASAQALSASSSDSTIVSVTDSGATTPATHTINSITSIASAASEHSLQPYANSTSTPVSTTMNMKLMVGTKPYTFSLTTATNNLQGLENKINSLNAGVTASILTMSGSNYLSISANSTGEAALQVIDDPGAAGHANTQLLTSTNPGSDAVFQLDGIPVDQTSNVVNNIVSGMSFNILAPSNTAVTLTLSSDPTQLTSALQDFVTNYNNARTALNAREGPAAGGAERRYLGNATGRRHAPVDRVYQHQREHPKSLRPGITFASNGQASFDPTAVSGFTGAQLTDAFQFIGSSTSGLVGASQSFQQFSDPIDGLIKVEANGLSTTDQSLQSQISTLTGQMTIMQNNLASQLSTADALIAELQSQQTSVNASIQGLNLVMFGKNTSTS